MTMERQLQEGGCCICCKSQVGAGCVCAVVCGCGEEAGRAAAGWRLLHLLQVAGVLSGREHRQRHGLRTRKSRWPPVQHSGVLSSAGPCAAAVAAAAAAVPADVRNTVVVVSRWFGGILLGPARFGLINNTARQLLEQTGFIQQASTAAGGKQGGKKHRKRH